jgi:hypothetical protein
MSFTFSIEMCSLETMREKETLVIISNRQYRLLCVLDLCICEIHTYSREAYAKNFARGVRESHVKQSKFLR